MKKLISGLVLAMASSLCFAQGVVGTGVGGSTNVVAGGAAAGAGGAAGAGAVIATNTVLITTGVVAAGMVAAGGKTETTATHAP